jgi:hypothetical protein
VRFDAADGELSTNAGDSQYSPELTMELNPEGPAAPRHCSGIILRVVNADGFSPFLCRVVRLTTEAGRP